MRWWVPVLLLAVGCSGDPIAPGDDDTIDLADTAPPPAFPALERHFTVLAHDSMRGRYAHDAGIARTEAYVAGVFGDHGLTTLPGLDDYRHEFVLASGSNPVTAVNVVGYLEGHDPARSDEVVMFSAHHDHLGLGAPVEGDSIYNGADDNASGVAAVLGLARRYAEAGDHARSLLFVTFSAEELGLRGSFAMARQMESGDFPLGLEDIVAVINIDMIGGPSIWGEGQAQLTGDERSDLFEVAEAALAGDKFGDPGFVLHRDPIPQLGLFFRSDNWPFAELGVVAHTVTTFRAGNPHYHAPSDEIPTVPIESLRTITLGIWDLAGPLVSGEVTPTLVGN